MQRIFIPSRKLLSQLVRYKILYKLTKFLLVRYGILYKLTKFLLVRYEILYKLTKILLVRYKIDRPTTKICKNVRPPQSGGKV